MAPCGLAVLLSGLLVTTNQVILCQNRIICLNIEHCTQFMSHMKYKHQDMRFLEQIFFYVLLCRLVRTYWRFGSTTNLRNVCNSLPVDTASTDRNHQSFCFSTLKMEAAGSPLKLISLHQTTRRHPKRQSSYLLPWGLSLSLSVSLSLSIYIYIYTHIYIHTYTHTHRC